MFMHKAEDKACIEVRSVKWKWYVLFKKRMYMCYEYSIHKSIIPQEIPIELSHLNHPGSSLARGTQKWCLVSGTLSKYKGKSEIYEVFACIEKYDYGIQFK